MDWQDAKEKHYTWTFRSKRQQHPNHFCIWLHFCQKIWMNKVAIGQTFSPLLRRWFILPLFTCLDSIPTHKKLLSTIPIGVKRLSIGSLPGATWKKRKFLCPYSSFQHLIQPCSCGPSLLCAYDLWDSEHIIDLLQTQTRHEGEISPIIS